MPTCRMSRREPIFPLSWPSAIYLALRQDPVSRSIRATVDGANGRSVFSWRLDLTFALQPVHPVPMPPVVCPMSRAFGSSGYRRFGSPWDRTYLREPCERTLTPRTEVPFFAAIGIDVCAVISPSRRHAADRLPRERTFAFGAVHECPVLSGPGEFGS